MSEKGKITRGRLGSLSLKKEGERQCFLFSKHLIICTRGSGGKLHLTKVGTPSAGELPGLEIGHCTDQGALTNPDQGPDSGQGCQRRSSIHTHMLTGPTGSLEGANHSWVFYWRSHGKWESEFEDAQRRPHSWELGQRSQGVQRSSFLNFYFFIFNLCIFDCAGSSLLRMSFSLDLVSQGCSLVAVPRFLLLQSTDSRAHRLQ